MDDAVEQSYSLSFWFEYDHLKVIFHKFIFCYCTYTALLVLDRHSGMAWHGMASKCMISKFHVKNQFGSKLTKNVSRDEEKETKYGSITPNITPFQSWKQSFYP